jgi:hypothetical protein
MPLFPHWLDLVCTLSLVLALICAIVILTDVVRHPPHMVVMAGFAPCSARYSFYGYIFAMDGRPVRNMLV